MAKRRLSQQQKNRIQDAQSARSFSSSHQQGRVISHRGGLLLLELDSGLTVRGQIKSNLGSIVCGDQVLVEKQHSKDYRVDALLPRENLLQRVDGFGSVRAVAANITQLLVCLAVVPEPNLFLLDQYLLSAEQQKINVVILLNKIDLADPSQADPFGLESIYAPLGYSIIATSVQNGQGMSDLRDCLTAEVSILGGVSGVGKSSLTSWLLPEEEIKIAALSVTSDEGRHTTRASRLYHLPAPEGDIIDTPGVRGFKPFIDSDTPVSHGFREVRSYGEQCKFHNCLHLNEPKCAVIGAVKSGAMTEVRYQNYLKLLDQSG